MAEENVKTEKSPGPAASHPAHDSSYPDHSKFPGLPKHFSLISAQKNSEHDDAAHASLTQDLITAGFQVSPIKSHHSHEEKAVLASHDGKKTSLEQVEQAAWKHGQDSVVHSSKGKNRMVFKEGQPEWKGKGFVHGPHLRSHFSQLPSGHRFQLHLKEPSVEKAEVFELLSRKRHSGPHHYGSVWGMNVFHALDESHAGLPGLHVHSPDDSQFEASLENAFEQKQPSLIVHGNPPPVLRDSAPAAEHPHSYDWHDGSTAFYLEGMNKAEHFTPYGHGAPAPHPVDPPSEGKDQLVGKSPVQYSKTAEHFGKILPGERTNLQFYRGLEDFEDQIDRIIAEAGYVVCHAGGSSPAPDFRTQNYDTKQLVIWEHPDDQDGFIRSYRKLHELSHALTLEEVNQLYGDGKRVGLLGERPAREAKRAVHWEWLAAHKQRELAEDFDHELSDDDFNKELNLLMQDSLYRVLNGHYADASKEGFIPSKELVPIEQVMKLIDETAKERGLTHEEATFRTTGEPKEIASLYDSVHKSEGKSGPLLQGEKIKKFYLWREKDATGVSGTGRVAEGVVFSNGWVGMNWLTRFGSLAFYPSVHDVLQVHGHQGQTRMIYENSEDDHELMPRPDEIKKSYQIPGLISPHGKLPSEEGYLYHATSHDRLHEIVHDGKLRTHGPSHGTDQSAWPDGATEKRSYWSHRADVVHSFAPEEGTSAIIRTKHEPHFKRESTGDHYTTQPVHAEKLETLTTGGWKPIHQVINEIKKAFLQGDGETLTDPKSHDQALESAHPALMEWGTKNLVPMKKDDYSEFDLAGKKVKVRKVLEDLYSGFIEHENHIIHQFEKLTLPLLLSQLQSKLELYGKEEILVADKKTEANAAIETPAEQKKEEAELADISSKLRDLQSKVEEFRQAEIKEHVAGKELAGGIDNPEKECSACERPVDRCVCFMNLPSPRVEITSKGVNIFFKSEWDEESKGAFIEDLKRRAGHVIRKSSLEKAKAVIKDIRKKP